LILSTSGTTAVPKGALLSHRMITWNAINTQISWGLRETDITPTFAPLFHAGGLNLLTTPLYHPGSTVVLLRNPEPETILHTIAQQRCTVVFAVPTVFVRLLSLSPAAHPGICRARPGISPGLWADRSGSQLLSSGPAGRCAQSRCGRMPGLPLARPYCR